jgi:dGTPase
VSQIARSVSRVLGLNEDLAEALALAHDLGHSPFGHAGEEALHAAMKSFGGFDHNAQTLRILTLLEHRYAEFDGLNLTWETLEGVVKHNGPILRRTDGEGALPRGIAEYNRRHDLHLTTFAGGEAQVAAIADDIAYNNHDIDDGLRAGLFSVEDLEEVPLAGPMFREVRTRYPDLEPSRLIHEGVRRMINRMVDDLIAETRARLADAKPRSVEDIRALEAPVVAFSDAMRANDRALKDFLFERMYRHYKVNRMTTKARRVVHDLFELLLAEPGCLPPEWQRHTDGPGSPVTAVVVADYIAGMTDRFALEEHQHLFDVQTKQV